MLPLMLRAVEMESVATVVRISVDGAVGGRNTLHSKGGGGCVGELGGGREGRGDRET